MRAERPPKNAAYRRRLPLGDRAGRPGPTQVLAGPLQLIGLTLLLCAFLQAYGQSPSHTTVLIDLYLAANVFLFAAVVFDNRLGGVSLLIGFFFLFFVALPARVQIRLDAFPFGSSYRPDELAHGFVIFTLAQLAFAVGGAIRRRKVEANQLVTPPMSVTHYARVAAVSTIISLLIALYVGKELLFTSRSELGSGSGLDTGMAFQLLLVGRSFSLFSAVTSAYLVKTQYRQGTRGPWLLALMLVSFSSFAVLNFPPSLPRFQLLGALLAVSGVVLVFFRVRLKLLFAFVAPPFLLYIFPEIKALGEGKRPDFMGAIHADVRGYLLRADFDAFKQVVDAWIYSQDHSLRWGENFLGVALFWVPRSQWPSKPINSGELVASGLGFPYTNVSSPLPAEALISFGMIGVIIVMGLFGYFVARLEARARYAQLGGVPGREVILYALVMGFVVIILRGALNSVAPMFGSGLLLYWISTWGPGRVGRATRVSSEPWGPNGIYPRPHSLAAGCPPDHEARTASGRRQGHRSYRSTNHG